MMNIITKSLNNISENSDFIALKLYKTDDVDFEYFRN